MKFASFPIEDAEDLILAHGVQLSDGKLKKGTRLSAEDVARLKAAGIDTVTGARLDAADITEDEAALRIANALRQPGLRIADAATGRVNIYAESNGVFCASRTVVDAMNRIDPGITIATLPDLEPVEAGRMVGTVKIIPYAVSSNNVEAVEKVAGDGPMSLAQYKAMRVGVVATRLPSLKESVHDKTLRVLQGRLAASGSIITREIRTSHTIDEVADAIAALRDKNDMIILFGASAICDENDVLPTAIRNVGGQVMRFGMPVDPGNLLLLGRLDEKPILGAPGCARSPAENGFDWVLDRLLAGITVTPDDIAGMGVGGLLMEIGSRPKPREGSTAAARKTSAIILAAGQSRRMGENNKLLAKLNDKALVAHVAEAALGSCASEVLCVTGHEADQVEAVLPDGVHSVRNDHYQEGLSSSLAAGIAALDKDIDRAVILLGDMPDIRPEMIDAMLNEADHGAANAITIATHGGKRGNPVIWPRAYFEALKSISGDIGARHLIEANRQLVIEVELGKAASFDLDTPEALEQAGGKLV